jgi:hypothetical protein
VNQLPGRDFDALTFTNYHYFERWIFPKNFTAKLESKDKPLPIVRIFRYNHRDNASKELLLEIDPLESPNDKNIIYLATIETVQKLSSQTLLPKQFLTELSLDPLKITLQTGPFQASLSLQELTDPEEAKRLLNENIQSHTLAK